MKHLLLRFLCTFALALSSAAAATLPVLNEQIVVTCFSGGYSSYYSPPVPTATPVANGFVVAQFDTTTGTIGPLIPAPAAPPLTWTGALSAGNHNEPNPGLEWTRSRLGEVFGIALDDSTPPNIYVTASDTYNVFGAVGSLNDVSAGVAMGPGGIYKLNANNGAATSAALPAQVGGPGLGNLCFYRAADNTPYFYVSNLEDGKIYRVSTALAVVGTPFDHGVSGRTTASLTPIPDSGAAGMTAYGRRIWGVKTLGNRLFYGVWWEDARNPLAAESNEIWSVDLNATGDFIAGSEQLRITLPNYPTTNWSYPAASIDFSPTGVMYAAERYWQLNAIPSGNYTGAFGPHFCRLHRYTLSGPTWVNTPSTHNVGANIGPGWTPTQVTGSNSAGGVAVNCDESLWATGDFFNGYPTPYAGAYLYGAMRIQAGGNFGLPHGHGGFIVDYDGAYSVKKVTVGAIATRRACCMTLMPKNIACPVTPGGPYTLDVNITNLTATPFTNVQFAPVPVGQLPPGAITLTPSPASVTLSPPIPGNGSGLVPITLPNVPPIGGTVCFMVQILNPGSSTGELVCQQMLCVQLPKCPCAVLTATNLQCPPCLGQPSTISLTIQNIWTTPYSWYSLVPCPPGELPPGATSVTPSPAGLQPLSPPLTTGNSVTVPVSLQGVPLSGGVVCFKVLLYDAQENVLLCEEKICFTFPACNPPAGMTLTPGTILCPQYPGGPFKLPLTITNNQPLPAYGAVLAPCSGPTGGNFFGVNPGTVTFAPPLAQGQSQTVLLCLTGLSLGESGCLCVQFLDVNGRPFCLGQVCFTMPAVCPPPACMLAGAVHIQCPTPGAGYTFDVNVTNNSGTAASFYQLSPVPIINLPPGAVTGQPIPAGWQNFGTPLSGAGGATTINNLQLPMSVPEGATFCFLLTLYSGNDQVICSQIVCMQLPRCACATATATVNCVPPVPNRQVVFTVTNNTNAFGTPFNFASAVIIPSSGFSPATMIPSPNPIVPGGTGTFTTTFTGYKNPNCIVLLLFNETRTRCCQVRVCPPWVLCDPGPPRDRVDMGSYLLTDLEGVAKGTAWITNESTLPKFYTWRLIPADLPECTTILPPQVFSPMSGQTPIVPPGSTQGISFSIDAASLAPAACAGFRICFSEISPFFIDPVCGEAVLRRSDPHDPVLMMNPTGRSIPTLAGDVDALLMNPSSEPLSLDLMLFDTGGKTAYATDGPPWPAAANEVAQHFTLEAGGIMPLLLRANIVIGEPPIGVDPGLVEAIWIRLCTGVRGYEILGSQVSFRPGGTAPLVFPPPAPRVLPVSGLAFSITPDFPAVHFTMPSEPGAEYHAFTDTDLGHLTGTGGTRIWPYPGQRMIYADDGTFLGKDGVMTLDLPGIPGALREFFRVQTAAPNFGPP